MGKLSYSCRRCSGRCWNGAASSFLELGSCRGYRSQWMDSNLLSRQVYVFSHLSLEALACGTFSNMTTAHRSL